MTAARALQPHADVLLTEIPSTESPERRPADEVPTIQASTRINYSADVQLGKLLVAHCAVRPCEKNRGLAGDTVRRYDPT
jgi:hypothetical protein